MSVACGWMCVRTEGMMTNDLEREGGLLRGREAVNSSCTVCLCGCVCGAGVGVGGFKLG